MTREEAIEVLQKNYPDSCYSMLREAVDIAIEALENQQEMADATKWIPCSERLPDTNDKVLVTMIENEYGDTKVYFGSYVKSVQLWMVEDRASYFTHVEVTAWKPIPEPYKEESGE